MRHLRFGSSVKKSAARVVCGVVDLLLRGKRYLRDLKFFTEPALFDSQRCKAPMRPNQPSRTTDSFLQTASVLQSSLRGQAKSRTTSLDRYKPVCPHR